MFRVKIFGKFEKNHWQTVETRVSRQFSVKISRDIAFTLGAMWINEPPSLRLFTDRVPGDTALSNCGCSHPSYLRIIVHRTSDRSQICPGSHIRPWLINFQWIADAIRHCVALSQSPFTPGHGAEHQEPWPPAQDTISGFNTSHYFLLITSLTSWFVTVSYQQRGN